MLDREIRKAAPGINCSVGKDGFGGAGILAAVAIGAVGFSQGFIWFERQINQNLTEKQPGSKNIRGQAGISGDPTQASPLREIFFNDRGGVHADQVG